MKFLFILAFFITGCAPAWAQITWDEPTPVHQHGYQEIFHAEYPSPMKKIQARLQDWMMDADDEMENILHSRNPKIAAWRQKVLAIPTDNPLEMIRQINIITNHSVTYIDDYNHYQKDLWGSPVKTLTEGGDCEDIALLKYVALYLKEWDKDNPDNINLLVGLINYNNASVPHADLEVDVDGKNYVMSSLNDNIVTFDDMNLKMKPLYLFHAWHMVEFLRPHNTLASLAAGAGTRLGELRPIAWDGDSD